MAGVQPFRSILFRPEKGPADWTSTGVEPLSPFTADRGGWPQAPPAAEWIDRSPGDVLVAYRQEFRTEGGLEKSRLGVLGVLDSVEDSGGRAHVAQDTEAFGVDRTLAELSATGVQRAPVVAAVEDLQFELEKLLERGILLRGRPDASLDLPDGDRHQVWRLDDPQLLSDLRAFFHGKECFLIDGLHVHRALRRATGSPARPMALFLNIFDFGVMLGAAALLIRDLPELRINDVALRLHAFFETKAFGFDGPAGLPRALADFREDLRLRGFTDSVVGGCFHGLDCFYIFQLREGVDREKVFLPDVKRAEQDFDAVLLRRVLLERYFHPEAGPSGSQIEYSWSFEEAIAAVRAGKFRAAFFVNAPNKRKLMNLARAGLRLPPGAARLEPPARSGLVMHAVRRTG